MRMQVHEATVAAGAYPSPLNYFNFPKSVCTSVNEARAALPTMPPCPLCNHADLEAPCPPRCTLIPCVLAGHSALHRGIPTLNPVYPTPHAGDLPRHPRPAAAGGRRHRERGRHRLPQRLPRRPERDLRRRRRRRRLPAAHPRDVRGARRGGRAAGPAARMRGPASRARRMLPRGSRNPPCVAAQALDKAIAAVKPGVRFRDVGDIISAHVGSAGFQVVKSYCGHGIGDLFHCAPNIPHYSHNKARGPRARAAPCGCAPACPVPCARYRHLHVWGSWRTALRPHGVSALRKRIAHSSGRRGRRRWA